MPMTPWLLVGLKTDLRPKADADAKEAMDAVAGEEAEEEAEKRKKKKPCVSAERALEEAMELGAAKYVECSALEGVGVDEVIFEAVKAAVAAPIIKAKSSH